MTTFVHNVEDRINREVGSVEVIGPVVLKDLTEADRRHAVIYTSMDGRHEYGRISSWNDRVVFVNYHGGDTAAATQPSDLRFAVKRNCL